MQEPKNKCPQCGQYKYVSMRLYYMLIGFVMMGVSIWLLILPPIGIAGIVIGALIFLGGIFANGRLCLNCKYSSFKAAQKETHA
jgi:hypothetical protein